MTRILSVIGYALIILLALPAIGACMATMSSDQPAEQPAALAPGSLPTAAIAEAPAPAELAPVAVIGWWAPDGEQRPFAEPPVITAVHARCGGRTDIVLVILADDSQAWLAAADANVTPELIAGLPNDVCAGVL